MQVEERMDRSNTELDQKTEESILHQEMNLNIEEQPRNTEILAGPRSKSPLQRDVGWCQHRAGAVGSTGRASGTGDTECMAGTSHHLPQPHCPHPLTTTSNPALPLLSPPPSQLLPLQSPRAPKAQTPKTFCSHFTFPLENRSCSPARNISQHAI